jgi:hypothetical protein
MLTGRGHTTEPHAVERTGGPPGDLLDALVSGARGVLAEDLTAVWLYGSSVSGDFEEGVSDVDLVAVTSRSIDPIDLPGLERMHRGLVARYPDWDDRIEVVYVARATLESFRTSTGAVAVISPGEPLHILDDRPVAWLQNWYLARDGGVALYGPEPGEVVPPIDWPKFVEATVRYADEVTNRDRAGASAGARAYDILSMCRALRTVRLNTLSSKSEGAAWVGAQMPDWRWLIDAAVECRRSGGKVGLSDDRSREATDTFLRILADEIASYRQDHSAGFSS